jgi:TonB family protein
MPTCFLKRVLPFALTLTVGVVMGNFLNTGGAGAHRASVSPHSSYAGGSGTGCRSNIGRASSEGRPFPAQDVDQKARILARPEPRYTEEARANSVTGTVVLRAVFSASGEVTNVHLVSGLPDGLTEKAVEAAFGIKFLPAVKDGRPVSQYIQIEYNFSLD